VDAGSISSNGSACGEQVGSALNGRFCPLRNAVAGSPLHRPALSRRFEPPCIHLCTHPHPQHAPLPCNPTHTVAARALRDETPDEALERRMRESARVEERVADVFTQADLKAALAAAGGKLVVLEAQSEQVCMTGLDEEPELHWKADQAAALQPCVHLKHTFQRTARECPDVVFLSLQVSVVGALERSTVGLMCSITLLCAGAKKCSKLGSRISVRSRAPPYSHHRLTSSRNHSQPPTPPHPTPRLTRRSPRSCAMSWALRWCRRCSFGATAASCGSTRGR